MSSSKMNIANPIDPNELFSAKDLVVVITGGGTGIGLAFTSALAAAHASKIFILGRRLNALQSAAEQTNPSVVIPVECDVSSLESVKQAAAAIAKQTSHVDVLVNNAGIDGPKHTDIKAAGSIEELSAIMTRDWELWQPAFATNTAAVVAASGVFLPLLDKGNERRGWASGKRTVQKRREPSTTTGPTLDFDETDRRTSQIITVTSISGFNREVTAGLAYTASKAGAIALGKTLANLLAPWGIRSNMIAPGRFPSELTAGSATEFPVDQIPAGGPGCYEDVASLILHMVGRAGSYMNGAVEVIDGGRLSVMPATF